MRWGARRSRIRYHGAIHGRGSAIPHIHNKSLRFSHNGNTDTFLQQALAYLSFLFHFWDGRHKRNGVSELTRTASASPVLSLGQISRLNRCNFKIEFIFSPKAPRLQQYIAKSFCFWDDYIIHHCTPFVKH